MNDSENTLQKEPHRPPYYDEKIEEKTNRVLLSSISWGLILIWAGLIFLARNLGWLDLLKFQQLVIERVTLTGIDTWAMIMIGAGVIVFFEAIIRTFVPAYRSSTGGDFFLSAVFLGIGLGSIFGWRVVWPFILIAMGLSALASALIQRR